jgi:hypothetical protein
VKKGIKTINLSILWFCKKFLTIQKNAVNGIVVCIFAFFAYIKLAGATRHCPGHYIKIIKCIVRAKVAR